MAARDSNGRFVKRGSSGGAISIDMSEYDAYFAKLKRLGGGEFKKAIKLFLEGLGYEFLRIVEDEIIRMKVVDTRHLLNSFDKSGDGNIWEISDGGMRLEVGTNVEYASFVNDGHWANPQGVEVRFVPGHWQGDRFVYEPGSKEGMVLKQQWVEGYHFWESALRIIEKMMPRLIEAKFDAWVKDYFGKL